MQSFLSGLIDRILEEDKSRPAKQQHTAKRSSSGCGMSTGTAAGLRLLGLTCTRQRQRLREMFVPLSHEPGHAQVDFGEALAVIAGEECKITAMPVEAQA